MLQRVYLGEDLWIPLIVYQQMITEPLKTLPLLLIESIWDDQDLARRALSVELVHKPADDQPVELIQQNLLRLLISEYYIIYLNIILNF